MEKCCEAAFLQLLTVSFGGNLTQTFLNRSFPSLCWSCWTESRLGHIILTFNTLWFTTVDTLKSYSRVVLFWVARLDQTYFSSSVFAFVLLALKRQPKTFRLNSTDKLLSNLYTQWLHKLKEKEKKKEPVSISGGWDNSEKSYGSFCSHVIYYQFLFIFQ